MDLKSPAFVTKHRIDNSLTVFNSSSFASYFLYEDLRKRAAYARRRSYLLGLAFGSSLALEKIRRIFVKRGD